METLLINKTSDTLVVQVRHTDRPQYRQFYNSLVKRDWTLANCDFVLCVTGDDDLPQWASHNRQVRDIWYLGRAYHMMARKAQYIFEEAYRMGYKYLNLLDDDAEYPDPTLAMNEYHRLMDKYPNLGQVGPMGSLYKFQKFNNAPKELEEFDHNQWTTIGTQFYRMEALTQWRKHWDFLGDMCVRFDVAVTGLLYAWGWDIKLCDFLYNHVCSSGLHKADISPEEWQVRMEHTAKDTELACDAIYRHSFEYNLDGTRNQRKILALSEIHGLHERFAKKVEDPERFRVKILERVQKNTKVG